ncbi:unnamed protein product [Effrenium voratum]|nr:unnamed protein product [Effrenium voratum]
MRMSRAPQHWPSTAAASWPPPTWAACGRWKSTACSSREAQDHCRRVSGRGGGRHACGGLQRRADLRAGPEYGILQDRTARAGRHREDPGHPHSKRAGHDAGQRCSGCGGVLGRWHRPRDQQRHSAGGDDWGRAEKALRRCGHLHESRAGQVRSKRLVILACELDSGHERRFTPETDPDLPLRVAVRMSMGVPGLMEPLKYRGHMYCDGGMCNDFPMNALPEDEKRIGLMVRPVDWIQHHIPGLQAIIPKDKLEKHPKVMEHLSTLISKKPTLWSVKTIMDLAMTSVNIMMDANLVLQIAAATARKQLPLDGGISELAPEILTLCGGRLDPFDFNLTKDQHRELYLSGQLSTHLHASIVDKTNEVLSDEGKLKTLLYSMHLDYPQMGTPIQR